jgi:hypothetical protein
MYAMTALGRVESNSDARPFELSQHAAWYLLAGMQEFMEFYEWDCQFDTLLLELERLRQWDEQFGGYYDAERYGDFAREIRARRAEVRRYDIWRDNTEDRGHG